MFSLVRLAALTACFALVPGLALAHDHVVKAGSLEIVHPWSRATPGGAKVAAGYVTVNNTGATADRLLAAAADEVAAKVEIHEVAMKDGVMSMKRVDGIAVPAGGSLTLKPGSWHIMFMDMKRPLTQGEVFAGSLTFEKAGTVAVKFTVEALGATAPTMPGKADPAAPMDHGGMDHSHH